jgi:predicted metal-dependent peptidase
MIPQGLYLPSRSGERLGEIALACDCSGSISDQDYIKIATELRTLHADLQPTKLHVVYFDHEVKEVETFGPDVTPQVRRLGGGGTAFSPIWPALANVSEDLACCVVLTDLYCNDFGPAPGYPVLWLTTGQTHAPWGEVTEVKD